MFVSDVSHLIPAVEPDEVFGLVANPSNHHRWRDELVDMTLLAGEPGAVGARYRERIRVGPTTVSSTFVVTEVDPPRRFSFEVVEPDWITSTNQVSLATRDGGTLVRFSSANRTAGAAAWLDPLWRWLFRRSLERELANLARIAAGGARPERGM